MKPKNPHTSKPAVDPVKTDVGAMKDGSVSLAGKADGQTPRMRAITAEPLDEYGIAWWDLHLKISEHDWLRLQEVQPDDAALLLSGVDPDTVDGLEALLARRQAAGLLGASDRDSFEMIKRLHDLFSRKSQGSSGPRSLHAWRAFAAEKGVPVHDWFDRFVRTLPLTELEALAPSSSGLSASGHQSASPTIETSDERALRILRRQRELKSQGVRDYTRQLAREENLSVSRISQLLKKAIALKASSVFHPATLFGGS